MKEPRQLCPYERFTTETDDAKKPAILPGYPNSDAGYWDWSMEDEWQAKVRAEDLKEELAAVAAEEK